MNRIACYVLFEKEGLVRDYVIYYLQGLKKIATKVVVIVNGALSQSGCERLNEIEVDIIIRENVGVDFWAYKAGLDAQGERLFNYDEIILANCSCYGPIYPFQDMFNAMSSADCDFWGITEWPENEGGYQGTWILSYFMVFRKKIFTSMDWKKYWSTLCPVRSREECIELHETKFTKWFADLGYKYTVYCKNSPDYIDMTIEAPERLVIQQKCPIIKRKAFCVEYNRLLTYNRGDRSKKTFDYIKSNKLYDTNFILDDLLASQHYEYIKNCLHLNYLLPTNQVMHPITKIPKIALCFHLYYPELLSNCFEYILSMPEYTDIYITTSKPELVSLIKHQCVAHQLERVSIKLISARGRAESAFLVACQDFIYDYEYVCIVHDKRSSFIRPGIIGLEFGWHNLDALLKTKMYVKNIIGLFENNPRLGLLVPINLIFANFRELYGSEWGHGNYEQVIELLKKFNINVPLDCTVPPLLPAGAMFWCRPLSLKKLIDKQWQYTDFPEEPLPLDGSLIHAIERAYPFFAQDAGYLTGWVASLEDAEVHLTNISYLYRMSKIAAHSSHANSVPEQIMVNIGVKGALREYLKKKIPQKIMPYVRKINQSIFKL